MSSDSSDAFCCFFRWYIILQLFIMRTWPSRYCVIIAPKWGVPNGNHMNDDVAEVNGSAPPQCYQALSSTRKSLGTRLTVMHRGGRLRGQGPIKAGGLVPTRYISVHSIQWLGVYDVPISAIILT